ncbi:prolipoprotein diacylglyceryl transferase [Vagococcus coleopterorum]|uniref:Phosphatidylglycerol--prolipoprotein diacylglyceryl transferase n=1 Tax=Vagococcus coleopterorum TaxID=2714946 RepID=A0A6G8ANK6_9ENTE|nr:prolipoprotein diacylglyceryl transferase [Vagococcus coleopterorum]QIL46664.1 prolipoprotein diacylglyceryl transferase [Vagococcus coleopterorum]
MSLFSSINPVAFSLFGLDVNWYGIIIVSGMLLAIILASKEAVRVGLKEDDVIDFMFWGLPLSIVGARLYYVAFEWKRYADNPIEIFAIRNGGLAIYGGLLAGAIAMYIFTKKRGISFWQFLDIAVPGVIIAQAIGRWGNFMNQEAYGGEVSRSFLENLHLPSFIIDNMQVNGVYHHPTFLYESLWNVLGFILLLILRRQKNFLKIGELTFIYVMWYSLGRFFIEGMRTDSLWLFDTIRVSQLLSVILFIIAAILLIYRRKVMKPAFYKRTVK